MQTKKPRKLALWCEAFPGQRQKQQRSEVDSERRSLAGKTGATVLTYRRKIKARTNMRMGQEAIYRSEVRKWLTLPENKWCRVWLVSEAFRVELASAGQHRVKPLPATQCHHIRGRRGPLLLARQWWCPVSSEGHQWIDRNPDAARKLGLLCRVGEYNTVPR